MGPKRILGPTEGRAIDWHLDARKPAQRRAAMRLIDTLLATDPKATSRLSQGGWASRADLRLPGVVVGMDEMSTYSYCEQDHGQLDPTQAHRNHVHIELNWPGARMETSFWKSPLAD